MKRLASLVLIACASLVLGAKGCDGDILSDPTFHTWCGDSLCAWKVEEGHVARAPTWHENDVGVSLVDTPTAISQTVTDTPKCILFTTIADVDPAAQVVLQLDFNADGSIDDEQPIAATGFASSRNQITAPLYYTGIRFVIRKKGQGRAVLAQIRAQTVDNCSSPPLKLHDLSLGSVCAPGDGSQECASSVCCQGLCADCCGDIDADGGIVPGTTQGCGDAGDGCMRRATGIRPGALTQTIPFQCSPGQRTRGAQQECLADDDCQSGTCVGASSSEFDLTLADGSPGDCEGQFPDAGNEKCIFGAVHGGHCR
jgi:hypothetical protein